MEALPNVVRNRLQAAAGDHPDPDLLTAFAEQALPEDERSRVLLHLSRCTECRDVLALALPPVTSSPAALDTARGLSWFRWPVLRWGAALACVVIVGSAVLMRREVFTAGSSQKVARYSERPSLSALDEGAAPEQSVAKEQQSPKEKTAIGRLTASQLSKDNQIGRRRQAAHIPESVGVVASAPAPPARDDKAVRGFAEGRSPGAGVGGIASTVVLQKAPATPASAPAEEAKKLKTGNELSWGRGETVEVTAAQGSIELHDAPAKNESDALAANSGDKREALGKAKAAPGSPMFDTMIQARAEPAEKEAAPPAAQPKQATKEALSRAKADRALNYRAPLSRWTISSDGQLQHSTDSGQTWQPVAVAEKATFRALSANGPDIWVGGAAGLLYHSSDAGAHWTQVKPVSEKSALSGDIAAIEFTDVYHGKITTASGESWFTEDAGQSWRQQ